MHRSLGIVAFVASLLVVSAAAGESPVPRSPAPEGARVYFISPRASETVSSPVTVRFGLEAMGVAPAGIAFQKTGHHHLIVDRDLPPLDAPLPADEHVRHFGGGQTEVKVELAPGPHTLQLVLGDQNHVPHDPPVISEKITITVK